MMNKMLSVLLGVGVGAVPFSAAADYVRENELPVAVVKQLSALRQAVDLRTTFPVASFEDMALKGLKYSANNWKCTVAEDATRTATITAQAGWLVNGVFSSDGSAELTVLPAATGEGTVDWTVTEISKKVYRLTHTIRKGDTVDAAGTCYGYLDFTHCAIYAPQADIEAAVLGAITHKIAVIQDEYWPWQPIDSAVRSGIETDELLAAEETTATTFTFKGRGVLHCEYELTGGTLAVVADSGVVSTFTETTAGWVPCQVLFDDFGAHEVSFVYTADGNGMAAIRNVRWEVDDESTRAQDGGDETRVDLQEGEIRTPKKFVHILPFVYSPTNFIGTVDGMASRVSVVQLVGDDPDVTKWVTEVPGTARILKECTDEGSVKWRAKRGVWKATFEIFDGSTLKDTQIKFFDLRTAKSEGFAVILF